MNAQQALQTARELLTWAGPLVAGGALTAAGEGTASLLAQRAWRAIQGWLARDADAADDLRKLEKQPTSGSRQEVVAEAVAQIAASDTAVANELAELVRAIAQLKSGSGERSHSQTISGGAQVGVAVAGDVHGGINHVQQSGGINLGSGNSFGNLGDLVAGDKVAGDKVMGDKVINYGAPKPADTAPEHINALIDRHTRRLRVLEQQAAAFGYHVPPHVQTEIEDIRLELARLREQLDS